MGTVQYFYSNVSVADTIGNSGGLATTDTTLTAGSLAPAGYPQSFPFKLRLEPGTPSEEVVKVSSGSGTPLSPWTIVRGWDGTIAAPHDQSAPLQHGMSQEDLALARTHESLDSTTSPVLPHGLPLAAWGSSGLTLMRSVTLSATQASINFLSITQQYTHLLLVVMAKTTSTAGRDDVANVTFNGDTSARYSQISAFWTDGTPTGSGTVAAGNNSCGVIVMASSASSAANVGGGFAFFPNYSGTTFNKLAFGISGMGQGTSGANASLRLRLCAYNPVSQVGITSMALAGAEGSFKAGSVFSLYGLG